MTNPTFSDCHYYEPLAKNFEACPAKGSGTDTITAHCVGCPYCPYNPEAAREILAQKTCWLCGGKAPDTPITVACETPGGKSCDPYTVEVHFGCYMEIEP